MKRILLTGANGMLGSAIHRIFQNKFDVIPLTRDSFNLLDFETTQSRIREISPDLIIHSAAYTNVEEAEKYPANCYQVNYTATLNIVNALKTGNTKFIYFSSTGCYGDYKDDPYAEYDPVNPTTVYHKSKYEGENIVRELCKNHLVLRLGWLFGGDTGHKKNFVFNRYLEAKKASSITSDPFQIGNPTNVADVANQLEQLIMLDVVGTYNVVAKERCSRYEYVKTIIENFDLPCTVLRSEKPFRRLAAVSSNESALNFNLDALGLTMMKNWQDSLKAYIKDLKTHV